MTVISSRHATNGPAASFTVEDNLVLPIGGFLTSDNSHGVVLGGVDQHYVLNVYGRISGATSSSRTGILANDNTPWGTGFIKIVVHSGGTVKGDRGIYGDGSLDIVNHGAITSIGGAAISMMGGVDVLAIVNSGTIKSMLGNGIVDNGTQSSIVNSGTITATSAGKFAIITDIEASALSLTNTGTINGNLRLGGGTYASPFYFDSIHTENGRINGTVSLYGGFDEYFGGTYTDRVYGGGHEDKLYGNGGADFLFGDAGDDYMDGGSANDVLYGGYGKDHLVGGSGVDDLRGGFDDDIYVVDHQGDVVAETSTGGFDVVRTSVSYALVASAHVEVLEPVNVNGSASLTLKGNGVAEQIIGGNLGANTLIGGSGRSALYGSGGNDSLFGGSGADVLFGGSGRDTLTGGKGTDHFVFEGMADSGIVASARDLITDFSIVDDYINLEKIDARQGGSANDAFQLLSKGTATSTVSHGSIGWHWIDQVDNSLDRTVLRLNLNTDPVIEMTIELVGLLTLTKYDFVL